MWRRPARGCRKDEREVPPRRRRQLRGDVYLRRVSTTGATARRPARTFSHRSFPRSLRAVEPGPVIHRPVVLQLGFRR